MKLFDILFGKNSKDNEKGNSETSGNTKKKKNKNYVSAKIEDNKLNVDMHFVDESFLGKIATLKFIKYVKVKDSRGIDESKVIDSWKGKIDSLSPSVQKDIGNIEAYSYQGNMIDIILKAKVEFNDGIIFDTILEDDVNIKLTNKQSINTNKATKHINPDDDYNFLANFKDISFSDQISVLLLLGLGVFLIIIISFVGVHDFLVSYSERYLYSKNIEGLEVTLIFDVIIGGFLWSHLKDQLKSYMKFHFKKYKFSDKESYKISDIVGGKSKVPLKNVELRVVAGNIECGKYERSNGSNTRAVSFKEPSNSVVIFQEKITNIPAKTNISNYFKGEFNFEEVYDKLYPSLKISKDYGLDLNRKIQLIHDKYIDQELIGPDIFKYKKFIDNDS